MERIFYDVYQKPHVLAEGIEPTTRRSARAIVINEQNEVLLIKTKFRHLFIFPGGGLEDGESDQEAAIRECLEESGYSITINSLEVIYQQTTQFYWDGGFYYGENVCYLANLLPIERKPTIPDVEVEEVVWRAINSLEEKEIYEFIWPAFAKLK